MSLLNNAFHGTLLNTLPFNLCAKIPTEVTGLNSSYAGVYLNYFLREDGTLSPQEDTVSIALLRFVDGVLQIREKEEWKNSSLNLITFLSMPFGRSGVLSNSTLSQIPFWGFQDTTTLSGEGTNNYFATPTLKFSDSLRLSGQSVFYTIPGFVYTYGNVTEEMNEGAPIFFIWVFEPSKFLTEEGWLTPNHLNGFTDGTLANNGYWFGNNTPCGGCTLPLTCLRNDLVPFGDPNPYSCQDPESYHKGPGGPPGKPGEIGPAGSIGLVGPRGETGFRGYEASTSTLWSTKTTLALILTFAVFFLLGVFYIAKEIYSK